MRNLLEIKASAGISGLRMKWILKEFDDFAKTTNLTDPNITSEFIASWHKTRKSDCEQTMYAKYSAWHQLTTQMSRTGCPCFIPKLPKMPKSDFTPYIFTKEQIRNILNTCDRYRLYDVRMGTSLFAMPTIFRLLYSTGLRISEAL